MKRILMVCLGNICRSPLAEGIMRQKCKEKNLDIGVSSAGTAAYHAGERPDPRSQEIARKHGIDISRQTARRFEVRDFDKYDRIYAMDRANYADLLSMARNREESSKVRLILDEIFPNQNRQVPDPYYGGRDGFEKVYDLLDQACEVIADDYHRQSK